MLASGSADGNIRIWNATRGTCERVLELDGKSVFGVAWSPDGRMIACGTDGGAIYLGTTKQEKFKKIYQHQGAVHSIAWSPDGKSLASASNDGTVRIFTLNRESEPKVLFGHEVEVYAVAWSPDGRLIASSGTDRSIRLWDATSAEKGILRGHERHVTDLAFSADGLFLASISWDHSVCIWNTRSLDLMTRLSIRSARRFHSGLVFNPAGGHALALVSESASAIEVWEPENEHIFALEEPSKDKYAPLLEPADLEQFLGAAESVGITRERLEKLLYAGPHHLASEIINLSSEQNIVFRNYLTLIQAFTGSPWNQMLLLRESELVVVAEHIDPKLQHYRYPIASWEGVIGIAAKTRKTFWAADVDTTPEYRSAVPDTKSELAIPLLTSRRTLGVVNIEWNFTNAIPAPKIHWLAEFCQLLADQLAKRSRTIFISYAAQDSPFAYRLAQNIRDAGGSPWLDQEQLRAGSFESVLAAIQHSGNVLFLMSQESVHAQWQERELDFASLNQSFSRIYPILIEDCPIPVKLRTLQCFDFRKNYSEGLAALFTALDLPFTPSDDAQDNNVASRQLHPEEDAANRGKLTRCSFVIHPRFMTHGAKRWEKWADLLVRLDHAPRRGYVYLIPSSSAPRELRDPGYLTFNTKFLELKRTFTKEFADLKRGSKLQGFWFYKSMRESATLAIQVYSEEYDDFLSSRLRSQSSPSQAESTKASKTLPYALVNVLCPKPVTFRDDPNERHGPYVRSRGKHRLDVPMSFRMGVYPVTNALYLKFVEDGGYSNQDLWNGNSSRGFLTLDKKTRGPAIWPNSRSYPLHKEKHPVAGISFLEATAFVKWLQLREPSNRWIWCLPTEDMWELAARSPEGFQYPWGQGYASNHCNSLEAEFGDTTEAGRFPQGNSSFGCADMAGNVWEFVTSPTIRRPVSCVLRGGSFRNNEYEIQSYLRLFGVPIDHRPDDFGFRCAQISVADDRSTTVKQKRNQNKGK